MFVEKKLQKSHVLSVAGGASIIVAACKAAACSKITKPERFVFYRTGRFEGLTLYPFINF
jgi:hypothetical protein